MTCFLRICSRFIGAVTSFNARRDLLSVTYCTTYELQGNKLQNTAQLLCELPADVKAKDTLLFGTHTDLLLLDDCRNTH